MYDDMMVNSCNPRTQKTEFKVSRRDIHSSRLSLVTLKYPVSDKIIIHGMDVL